jgi:ABC-type transporter Mla maintaining outer membrane lipid asymmetry ATPase subunit MlaF
MRLESARWSTHDMASARKIADDIAMIHKGRILWQGPAGQIDCSGNAYVDQFIPRSSARPYPNGSAEGMILRILHSIGTC